MGTEPPHVYPGPVRRTGTQQLLSGICPSPLPAPGQATAHGDSSGEVVTRP